MSASEAMLSQLEDDLDVIWGAEAIGSVLGVSQRRAFYLLVNGEIPAKKIGGRWCTTRGGLRQFFANSIAAA